jgi:hypothetical protein
MKSKAPLLFLLIFLFSFEGMNAQIFSNKLNKNKAAIQKNEIYEKKNFPSTYHLVSFDVNEFKNLLNQRAKRGQQKIQLPNPNGGFSDFVIKETSNFETALSEKFSTIKSYSAQGISDPTAVAKISIGTDGFHAVVFSGKEETLYVDPYTKDNKTLITYKKSDLASNKDPFTCQVEAFSRRTNAQENTVQNANDGKSRTFRLALACSGEYAQFHIANQGVSPTATVADKKAAVLSAMNTTMTRVNGVFEKDISVKMVLVANNDALVFLDAASDGITDGDPDAILDEVQVICDAQIGTANYDIGHVFSIDADGLAGLGVVCDAGLKAQGVTGRSQPIGDPYDIDFVAHEMGHQFGATHTFNNSCEDNRSNATAVEPGSGSTIMAYAGICSPNVQRNSDVYFHTVSITQMWNEIQSFASCAVLSPTNNAAPTANAGGSFSIPKSTPFVLKGTATDADGLGSLTYNWEQTDLEIAMMPPVASNSGGPLFRTLPSKEVPVRYLPELATVVAGNMGSTWEVLPSVARDLNFSFLVRDNHAGGGSTARDDVRIVVVDTAPFTITAPITNVNWFVGTTQTITWEKGTTDTAPINCQNVNIKLSIDGGNTFTMLKANTPNDGAEDVIIPNTPSTTSRILVEAADNIFYNVNATNFAITLSGPTFVMSDITGDQTVCNGLGTSVTYDFDFQYVSGFSESVTLSAIAPPVGSTITFNPAIITSAAGTPTTFTMTISNLENVPIGPTTIRVKGTATSINKEIPVVVNVFSSSYSPIILSSPVNSSLDVSNKPVLNWQNNTNATSYVIQVSEDPDFTNTIINQEISSNSYSITDALSSSKIYYWRVKGKNICGESAFSSVFNFTTQNCTVCPSSGSSVDNTSIILVKFKSINNTSEKAAGYTDETNIVAEVQRGDSHELTVNVNTGGVNTTQTKVWIDWNRNCNFNDAGEAYDLGSVNNNANSATSLSPLMITIPEDAAFGDLVMRIATKKSNSFFVSNPTSCETSFLGEVEDYTLRVVDSLNVIEDRVFDDFNLYPNPTKGAVVLNLKLKNTTTLSLQLFDVRGKLVETKVFSDLVENFSEKIFFNKASAGLYLLKIMNGDAHTTRKLIIE